MNTLSYKWAAQSRNLKIVYTITEKDAEHRKQLGAINITYNGATETKEDWNGERGRIDRTMIERHLSKEEISNAIFYICGPPRMINALKKMYCKTSCGFHRTGSKLRSLLAIKN
jgi:NAD(P)H-flavin reductase